MITKRYSLIAVLIFCSVFVYGIMVGKYAFFPYHQLAFIKELLLGDGKYCNDCESHSYWSERLAQFREFPTQAENVFVGDSITHHGHWREIFPAKSVLNRGIGWDTSKDVLNRLDTVFSSSPKRVFLLVGINDFFHTDRTVEDVFVIYVQIIKEIRKRNINVLIQSTLTCSDCGQIRDNVLELNKKLEAYSLEEGIVFVDLNEYLSDENGLLSKYQKDKVHLNVDGYKVWASLIEPYLL
jgi:lysophospholipase L1-like esterase